MNQELTKGDSCGTGSWVLGWKGRSPIFTSSLTLLLKEKGTAPLSLRRGVGGEAINRKFYRTTVIQNLESRNKTRSPGHYTTFPNYITS
jgi:hypothetical protein